jgi:hypothetical protein
MIPFDWDVLPADFTREEYDSLDEDRLQGIWEECVLEFYNPDMDTRAHYNARTYQHGCRGPLCTAANRAATRRRHGHEATGEFKIIDPIIERFYNYIRDEQWTLIMLQREKLIKLFD